MASRSPLCLPSSSSNAASINSIFFSILKTAHLRSSCYYTIYIQYRIAITDQQNQSSTIHHPHPHPHPHQLSPSTLSSSAPSPFLASSPPSSFLPLSLPPSSWTVSSLSSLCSLHLPKASKGLCSACHSFQIPHKFCMGFDKPEFLLSPTRGVPAKGMFRDLFRFQRIQMNDNPSSSIYSSSAWTSSAGLVLHCKYSSHIDSESCPYIVFFDTPEEALQQLADAEAAARRKGQGAIGKVWGLMGPLEVTNDPKYDYRLCFDSNTLKKVKPINDTLRPPLPDSTHQSNKEGMEIVDLKTSEPNQLHAPPPSITPPPPPLFTPSLPSPPPYAPLLSSIDTQTELMSMEPLFELINRLRAGTIDHAKFIQAEIIQAKGCTVCNAWEINGKPPKLITNQNSFNPSTVLPLASSSSSSSLLHSHNVSSPSPFSSSLSLYRLHAARPVCRFTQMSAGLTEAARRALSAVHHEENYQNPHHFYNLLPKPSFDYLHRYGTPGSSSDSFLFYSPSPSFPLILHILLVHGANGRSGESCMAALFQPSMNVIGMAKKRLVVKHIDKKREGGDGEGGDYLIAIYISESFVSVTRKPIEENEDELKRIFEKLQLTNNNQETGLMMETSNPHTNSVINLRSASAPLSVSPPHPILLNYSLSSFPLSRPSLLSSFSSYPPPLFSLAIDLSAAELDPITAFEIVNYLKEKKNITALNINKNAIGDEGAGFFLKYLSSPYPSRNASNMNNNYFELKYLDLAWNRISLAAMDQWVSFLFSPLLSNNSQYPLSMNIPFHHLEALSLWGNELGDRGIVLLISALLFLNRKNNTISDHKMNNNTNDDNTAPCHLRALNLENTSITNKSLPYLCSLLLSYSTLHDLLLADNWITDDGCILLAQAVRWHKGLRKLNLDGNPLGSKGFEALIEAQAERNHNLKPTNSIQNSNAMNDSPLYSLSMDFSRTNIEVVNPSFYLSPRYSSSIYFEIKECKRLLNIPLFIANTGYKMVAAYLERKQRQLQLKSNSFLKNDDNNSNEKPMSSDMNSISSLSPIYTFPVLVALIGSPEAGKYRFSFSAFDDPSFMMKPFVR